MTANTTFAHCRRCNAKLKLDPIPDSKARMLRRAKVSKGYCLNCAVHDWLRNTYPPNILLAQSGPSVLLFPHIQEQFAGIMKSQLSDAKSDEIDWQKIVDNWDLPFPDKLKPSPMNPVRQKELDEISSGGRKAFSEYTEPIPNLLHNKKTITSFEELNELSPGLGDQLKQALTGEPKKKEKMLF